MLEFLNQTIFKIATTLLILTSSFLPNSAQEEPAVTPTVPEIKSPLFIPDNNNEVSPPSGSEEPAGQGSVAEEISETEELPFLRGPFSQEGRQRARTSTVNIYCVLETLGPSNPLTASGVIIDPKGVILTNAHVAQYLLLRDYLKEGAIECSVRSGSPARDKYQAEVLYISPEWIERHKENIFSKNPKGTGKDDYAFLLITETVGESNLPESFPHLPPETDDREINKGDDILISAYPAGVLDSLSIRRALFGMTLESKIKNLLTFGDNQIDVISTGGSYLAQKGSSGGAVINTDEEVIGLFVTSTQEEETRDRDLRAVTLSHIERSLGAFGNIGLEALLSGDVRETSRDFNEKVSPLLAEILIEEIRSR